MLKCLDPWRAGVVAATVAWNKEGRRLHRKDIRRIPYVGGWLADHLPVWRDDNDTPARRAAKAAARRAKVSCCPLEQSDSSVSPHLLYMLHQSHGPDLVSDVACSWRKAVPDRMLTHQPRPRRPAQRRRGRRALHRPRSAARWSSPPRSSNRPQRSREHLRSSSEHGSAAKEDNTVSWEGSDLVFGCSERGMECLDPSDL